MTRDAFTPSDAQSAPPSIPVRHWYSAIGLGLAGALSVFVGVAALLWRPLPLLGTPPETLGEHLIGLANLIGYALTGGNFAGDAARNYLDRIGDLAPAIRLAIWSRFGLSALIAGYISIRIVGWGARPRSAEQHLSGAQLRTGADAVRAAKTEAAQLRGGQCSFMRLHPALDLPKSHWCRGGVLVVGSPGSGKSQIIAPILQQIVDSDHRAIVFDAKGEFRAAFEEPILLSPFDARSAVWDIGADLRTRDDAAVFATALIPESDKNPFFSTGAQMLLTGIVWSLQTQHGHRWGWKELAQRVASSALDLETLLKSHYVEAAALLNPQARSAGDVHSTLLAATRLLRSLAAAWGQTVLSDGKPRRHVSLRAWMRDDYASRARQLILGNGPNPQLTRAYVSAMLNVLVPHLVSPELPDDPARTLCFVLDELPALGRINLPPLLDRGRSKGIICVLGLQDFAQMKLVYGAELAATIQSMAASQVICQIGSGETRDVLAARFGKRRVAIYETTTTPSGTSQRIVEHHDRPIVLPSDLTQDLGPRQSGRHGFVIRAMVTLGGDILRLDFPGTAWPAKRRAFVPAPWLSPVNCKPAAAAATSPAEPASVQTSSRADLLRQAADRLNAVRRAATLEHADDPAP